VWDRTSAAGVTILPVGAAPGDMHMLDHAGRIVIVEDDPGLNLAMSRVLEAAGHRTKRFDSAEAFLAHEGAAGADCLVLDLHLPGMSGLHLYEKLASGTHACPVIFVTAHDDAPTRERMCRCGTYLAKPFSGPALIQAVGDALRPQESAVGSLAP
jgi:FixJ family two-component response regulator